MRDFSRIRIILEAPPRLGLNKGVIYMKKVSEGKSLSFNIVSKHREKSPVIGKFWMIELCLFSVLFCLANISMSCKVLLMPYSYYYYVVIKEDFRPSSYFVSGCSLINASYRQDSSVA